MTDWWADAPLARPVASAEDWWSHAPIATPGATAAPVEADPIRAQVRSEIDAAKASGQDTSAGYGRRILQGLTMGGADEVLAAAETPIEMIRRGTINPVEAFKYAHAREQMDLDDGAAKQGALGTIAEMGGGLTSGVKLLKAGVTALPRVQALLGEGLIGTSAGLAADGAGMGAVSGALNGDGFGDRIEGAKHGATVGGAVGGLAPSVVTAAAKIASPIVSNIAARVNPAGYAERQVGRAVADAGMTADDVADRLALAAADGQPEYRLMDALGHPGQRAAATVAKNPGEGRVEIREFLNDRQLDQGRRVANTLAEGFDAPQTAAKAEAGIKAARDTAADVAYGQARADAGAVDTSGAIRRIDETLKPGITGLADPASGIANDSVEAVLARARSLLTDGKSRTSGFEAVQRVKADLDDMVSSAVRSGQNNRARLLGQVARELDGSLEAASPSYAGARNAYRQGSREIEAVDTGRTAATRGRTEDTIPAFRALQPGEQAGFRAGYADPLIEAAQGAAEGVNKARPLTSQAFRDESAAIAPMRTGPQMTRRIGRENEMFTTRAKATGGSDTAENLSDNAAHGIDTGLLAKIILGEWTGAAKDLGRRAGAGLTGNTEAVRSNMAGLLTKGDAEEIRGLLSRVAEQQARRSQMGLYVGRSASAGMQPLVAQARPRQITTRK